MELKWREVEGTQTERPKEIDTTSSPRTVYVRRNISQKVKPQENGEDATVWVYEEAMLTLSEYTMYQKELAECGSLSQQELMESNLVLMGALADSFEQQLVAGENQLITMGAIADMFENIMLGLAAIEELLTTNE